MAVIGLAIDAVRKTVSSVAGIAQLEIRETKPFRIQELVPERDGEAQARNFRGGLFGADEGVDFGDRRRRQAGCCAGASPNPKTGGRDRKRR